MHPGDKRHGYADGADEMVSASSTDAVPGRSAVKRWGALDLEREDHLCALTYQPNEEAFKLDS